MIVFLFLQEFRLDRKPIITRSLSLPASVTVGSALERVLRLPTVSSKRFLTNKVDRCVTGLIAQQQCVGPLHTPLADFAVTALSIFNTVSKSFLQELEVLLPFLVSALLLCLFLI